MGPEVSPERILKVLCAMALVAMVWGIFSAGQSHQRQKQQLASLSEQLTETQQVLDETRRQATVTSEVLSARAESKARIVTVTKEIVREVPVLVPAGTPPLPGGWRVLHDAAAEGVPADPASGADAAPVGAAEAAETVVENYGACRDTADQLARLQEWIRGVMQ